MFFVYRGLGGNLAALSPVPVGFVLHFILVTVNPRHDFDVLGHLWSAGLSLFFGGLAIAGVLYYYYYRGNMNGTMGETTQTATRIPTDEIFDENAGDNLACPAKPTEGEDSPSVTRAAPHSVEQLPTAVDVYGQTITLDGFLWRMATQPMGTDHICFMAPNQIAVAYMLLGALLIVINLLQIVLAPVGGLFATILWIFLIGFGYFLKVMVCSGNDNATQNNNITFDNENYNDNALEIASSTQKQQDPIAEEGEAAPNNEIV